MICDAAGNKKANICTSTENLAALLRAERLVWYRPCLAHACGGAQCALLLSQFWFWTVTPTVQRRGGWFWKSQQEITEETGLTRTETQTARRKLRALGVLFEERRGVPATLHFRLDPDALRRRLRVTEEMQIGQASLQDSCKLECANPANQFSQTLQTNSNETAHQTQTKTQTQTVLPAALPEEREEEKAQKKEAAPPDRRALTDRQCQVNQQGTARLKAALQKASVQAARRAPDTA